MGKRKKKSRLVCVPNGITKLAIERKSWLFHHAILEDSNDLSDP